jgi:hypothetical protein
MFHSESLISADKSVVKAPLILTPITKPLNMIGFHQRPPSARHNKTPLQIMKDWYDQKPELSHRKLMPSRTGCKKRR